LLAAAYAAPGSAADDVSVEAERRGDVVEIHARALIAAPAALVWQVLTDYEGLARFIPGISKSSVREKNGNRVLVDQAGEARFLVFSFPIEVRLEVVEGPPDWVTSRAIAGNLKRMSGRRKEAIVEETTSEAPEEVEAAAPASVEEPFEIEYWPMAQEWAPPPPQPAPEETVVAEGEQEFEFVDEPDSSTEVTAEHELQPEELASEDLLEDGLLIGLLDDDEFYSGERYTLRVLISNRVSGDEKPLQNVAVSVKILGTTFRPLIYTLKTESDGVASLATEIPQFTSGRAAVLIRAVTKDQAVELRRIIHPAQ